MSESVNFPDIRPTGRTYNPGTFPQTEFAANNGAVSIIRFGNKRVDSQLTLEFTNISNDEAAEILDNYRQVNSDWDYVRFNSDNGTVGIEDSQDLREYIREANSGLRWRYASAPVVRSLTPGRSSVSCEFRGFWDAEDDD